MPLIPPPLLRIYAGLRGRSVTLKIKRKQEGAPEPTKFLGHGWCDNLSRTATAAAYKDSADQVAGSEGRRS